MHVHGSICASDAWSTTFVNVFYCSTMSSNMTRSTGLSLSLQRPSTTYSERHNGSTSHFQPLPLSHSHLFKKLVRFTFFRLQSHFIRLQNGYADGARRSCHSWSQLTDDHHPAHAQNDHRFPPFQNRAGDNGR